MNTLIAKRLMTLLALCGSCAVAQAVVVPVTVVNSTAHELRIRLKVQLTDANAQSRKGSVSSVIPAGQQVILDLTSATKKDRMAPKEGQRKGDVTGSHSIAAQLGTITDAQIVKVKAYADGKSVLRIKGDKVTKAVGISCVRTGDTITLS